MADVTIKYGGQTITSLSDSGTEVLEISGTFLTDDITIDYVKSGGGGTKTVDISLVPDDLIWVDGDGTAHVEHLSLTQWPTIVCLSGSLIIFTYGRLAPGEEPSASNAQLVTTIDHGSRASYRYTSVYQVD